MDTHRLTEMDKRLTEMEMREREQHDEINALKTRILELEYVNQEALLELNITRMKDKLKRQKQDKDRQTANAEAEIKELEVRLHRLQASHTLTEESN